MNPIFLSASLPDPTRDPKYYSTADIVAARECVRALATVVLPRTRLVFGGHPAITPLVRRVGERLGQMSRVRIYQSAFFAEHFVADNEAFSDVVVTPAVVGNRDASLRRMREEMIGSEAFGAGVFVGGMEGVEEEFAIFCSRYPDSRVLPVASTGAAARILFNTLPESARRSPLSKLAVSRVYGALFEELLGQRKTRRHREPTTSSDAARVAAAPPPPKRRK